MFRVARQTVSLLTAFTFVCPLLLPAPAAAQTLTIEECRNLADADVKSKIRELTEAALKTELGGLNYRQFVDARWLEARMNARIDASIDAAVTTVRADTSWLDRAYSNVSRETAERFATQVAERAYGSDEFKAALAELSGLVGKDIGARIEKSAGNLSNPVIACVQSALQTRYGGAIANVFAQETEKSITAETSGAKATIDATDLALQGGATISGVILVVTRRVIARMVAGIGTRIAGAIATRIISTFTGLVGLALIASDIYQAGEGVFPLIAERMKSDEAKDLIKQEVVKTLQTDVVEQLTAIGAETADRIYSLWLDFRQKYNTLLRLGDKSAEFAAFLKERKIDQLGQLGQIVDIIIAGEGESGVFKRLDDGSLSKALFDLGDPGIAIATEKKSLEEALAWLKLAGTRLPEVASLEIYKFIQPASLTEAQLATLLALDDKTAVSRLAKLDDASRALLLTLPPAQLKDIAKRFSEAELTAFADYQRQLAPAAARRIVQEIGDNPGIMQSLAKRGVQKGILKSEDQLAALDMLLRSAGPVPDLERVYKDFEAVTEGRVNYRVFWERYTLITIAALVLALIVLMMLRQLFFGRPR